MTLATVRKKALGIIAEVAKGLDPGEERKRLRKLPTLLVYFEDSFKPAYMGEGAYRASTRDAYVWAFKKHVLPALGAFRLDQIRRTDVVALVTALVSKGYALDSISDVLRCLRRVLNEAVEDRLIQENPVRKMTPLYRGAPRKKKEANPLTREEMVEFLRSAKKLYCDKVPYYLCMTALHTGLRSGELVALKWEDIDFEAGWTEVKRNYSHGEMNAPKTATGHRFVDLSDFLMRELKSWRKTLQETWLAKGRQIPEWVFPNAAGNMLDIHNVKNRAFNRVLQDSEVKRVPFHGLRDTFATQLLMAGEPLTYVSAQLGHSDPRVTLAHYAKWLPGANRARQ